MKRLIILLLAICCIIMPVLCVEAKHPPLVLEKTILLPDFHSNMSYMGYDLKGSRLFLTGKSNNTVVVVDFKNGTVLQVINKIKNPHGIAYVPAPVNKVFVATGNGGTVVVIDAVSYKILNTIDFKEKTDSMRYSPNTNLIYVAHSNMIGIINPATDEVISNIEIGGYEPQGFQVDEAGKTLYVNVQDIQAIVVADVATKTITAKWALPENFRENSPLALDEKNHRLFIAVRDPGRFLVYDITSGKQVAMLDCASDQDAMFYDKAKKRIYISSGDGFIAVYKQETPDKYTFLANVPTGKKAKTGMFIPELKRYFAAIGELDKQKAAINIYKVKR